MAFWASKYSLKGFCSAAPSSGTALFPPTQREGGWGVGGRKRERQEREEGGEGGVVGHKSRHVIVTHQPKGSNKGRHAVLSPVQCRSRLLPLSEKRERRREQRVRSLHCSLPQTHTDRQEKTAQTVTQLKTQLKRVLLKNKNQNRETVGIKLSGPHTAAAAAVSATFSRSALLYTHTRLPLLIHTHR